MLERIWNKGSTPLLLVGGQIHCSFELELAKSWTRGAGTCSCALLATLLGNPFAVPTMTCVGSGPSHLCCGIAILKCPHLIPCSWDGLDAEWPVATVPGHIRLWGQSPKGWGWHVWSGWDLRLWDLGVHSSLNLATFPNMPVKDCNS